MLTAREEASDKHRVLCLHDASSLIVPLVQKSYDVLGSVWMSGSDFLNFVATNGPSKNPFFDLNNVGQLLKSGIGGTLYGVTIRFSRDVQPGILIFCGEGVETCPVYHACSSESSIGLVAHCSRPSCVTRSIMEA